MNAYDSVNQPSCYELFKLVKFPRINNQEIHLNAVVPRPQVSTSNNNTKIIV